MCLFETSKIRFRKFFRSVIFSDSTCFVLLPVPSSPATIKPFKVSKISHGTFFIEMISQGFLTEHLGFILLNAIRFQWTNYLASMRYGCAKWYLKASPPCWCFLNTVHVSCKTSVVICMAVCLSEDAREVLVEKVLRNLVQFHQKRRHFVSSQLGIPAKKSPRAQRNLKWLICQCQQPGV